MKHLKRMLWTAVLFLWIATMTGCVIAGNEGFDDLTEEEKQEAITILDETKDDLNENLEDLPVVEEHVNDLLDGLQGAFEADEEETTD